MSTPQRKPDRRIQRTRHALRDALMALIVEKGYANVTVQDITDRADTARTTFYLHFKDVDELLFATITEIYTELFQATAHLWGEMLKNGQYIASTADFEHVAQYRDFYRVMLSEQGSMKFFVQVQQFLAQQFEAHLQQVVLRPTPLPLELIAWQLAGAEIGAVSWWLRQDPEAYPITQMAAYCEEIMLDGLKQALGWQANKEST